MGVAAIVSEKHRETIRRRTYSSRFLGISSSAVNGGDSTVAGRRRPGKDVEVSLSCPAEGRRSNCPATGESAGRGFRRGTATTGTGFAEVWDRNEAKGRLDFVHIALQFPAIGMALHKRRAQGLNGEGARKRRPSCRATTLGALDQEKAHARVLNADCSEDIGRRRGALREGGCVRGWFAPSSGSGRNMQVP
jgi:hypothetical protein